MRIERKAAEKEKEQSELPKRLLTSSVDLGVLGRLTAFFNPLLPLEIAKKGIIKAIPRSKNFFDDLVNQGKTVEEGIDFMRDKAERAIKSENIPKKEKTRLETLGKFQEKVKKRKVMEEERERFENYYQSPSEIPTQEKSQNIGKGESALIEVLKQLNARL